MDYGKPLVYCPRSAFQMKTISIVLIIYFNIQSTATVLIGGGKCGLYYWPHDSDETPLMTVGYSQISFDQLQNLITHLTPENTIPAGLIVAIPCSADNSWGCGPCGNQYVAQMEEMLHNIGRKCGIDVVNLERLNYLIKDKKPHGTIIMLPCKDLSEPDYDLLYIFSSPSQLDIYPVHEFRSPVPESVSRSLALLPAQSGQVPVHTVSSKALLPSLESALHSSWNSFSSLSPSPLSVHFRSFSTLFLPSINESPSSSLSEVATINSSGFRNCGICGITYVAGIGDTLESVSAYCNVQLQQLLTENPAIQDSNITGKTLTIPCTGEDPAHCTVCGSSRYIKEGDTLALVSDTCGIELASLEMANLNIDYDVVAVGEYITIPCGNLGILKPLTGCGVCGISYTAPGNKTTADVAHLCGASVQELQTANPVLKHTSQVLQGQIVNIPCTGNYTINCGLCGTNYTVTATDSLGSVALKCRVGLIELQLSNPGVTASSTVAGQMLKIPCQKARTNPTCSPCSPSVQVLSNETNLIAVSHRCNVSTDLLSFANNIHQVKEGQILFVPCATVGTPRWNCSICGSSITLHAFVTMDKISEACNLDELEIIRVNPSLDLSQLAPGDRLYLPCNDSQTACGPCGIKYSAVANDTLQSVAVKCAIMASQVKESNPAVDFGQPLDGIVLAMPCYQQGSVSAGVISKPSQLFSLEILGSLLAYILSFLFRTHMG